MYYNVVIWLMVIGIVNCLQIIVCSNGKNQTIPQVPKFSCMMPTLSIYYQSFTIYILNLPRQIHSVKIHFEQLNDQQQLIPAEDNSVTERINASNYTNDQQITQKIIITIGEQVIYRKLYVFKSSNNQQSWNIQLPALSIIATQILALLIIILLPFNLSYRRFKPLTFNLRFAIFYIFLIFIGTELTYIFKDDQIHKYLLLVLAFIFGFIYIQDIVSYLISNRKIIADIVSLVLVVSIFAINIFILQNAWFLNDMIACLFSGTLIKFVVIKKLRSSCLPLTILWISFLIRQFALDFHLAKFSETLQTDLVPLYIQLPSLTDKGFACSAFENSKIVIFGTILHYSIRIDTFLSIKFYRIMTILMIILCTSCELIINLLFDDVPTMQFFGMIIFIPLSFTLFGFFGSKRGEWAQIWYGSFYDIAVNRVTLSRQPERLRVSQDFGADLINRSQIW